MAECVLVLDKETDNKWRWAGDVSGVTFELYIPKHTVPDPAPNQIHVEVHDTDTLGERYQRWTPQGIWATVEFVTDHTGTVRYRPVGRSKDWLIGEPYIPKSLLNEPWPEQIGLVVRWA